ncbi:hypothetical protein [Streptomonospora litoralis]|uniref:Uncharacterized protein n=1 Tax=Streptomonospora litoralis TaxID=2498135 RepID=A0A4V0ZKG2_9ACTN|nr:hypothetical protein [Streptomonospora litoralis]QBI56872.1 hypothetical protein EKD16_25660 [Streptomonospora litoralis]
MIIAYLVYAAAVVAGVLVVAELAAGAVRRGRPRFDTFVDHAPTTGEDGDA